MTPSDRQTLFVQAGGEAVIVIGAIDVVLDVLFTAPHHLYGEVDFSGDLHSLGDVVHVEPTAEPAAQQAIVDLNLLQWQTGDGGCRGSGAGCDLRADPDVAAVVTDVRRTVHRFHGGVRQKRQLVDGFDGFYGTGHRFCDVALALGDHCGSVRGVFELFDDILGRNIGVFPVVPRDVERSQALLGSPHMIRDDSNGVFEANDPPHAPDRFRFPIVDVRQFSANHRASRHSGNLHAQDFDVDSKLRFAVHFVGRVEALGGRTDQLEVFWVYQRDVP